MTDKFDKWIKQLVHDDKTGQPNPAAEKKDGNSADKRPDKQPRRHFFRDGQHSKGKVRVIPLGGLDEVGKNMMLFEYGSDIIIVDMGFQFPEEDMLGIDYVIPDVTYLEGKVNRIRGVFLTHGHLDHIGAIPYLVKKLGKLTFYGAPLTIELAQKRLEEFNLKHLAVLHKIDPDRDMIRAGSFKVDFFRVNHSIPDSVGIRIGTPVGAMVHTGDFKFDFTPADGVSADLAKMARIGSEGVLALFSDSTNAVKPGHTMTEKEIGENLDRIIEKAEGRIIVASFSSLIGRIQQIIDSAQRYGRAVFVGGRSMDDNIRLSMNMGIVKAPKGFVKNVRSSSKVDDSRAVLLTTGGQGEAYSALTKISLGDHPDVSIKKGDTVVISSHPIPGNERAITTVINNLCKLGAKVVFSKTMDVHTSGHGHQEELKLMLSLIKPRYLVPVHGEFFMRQAHGEIGKFMGMKSDKIVIVENGNVIEFDRGQAVVTPEKVSTNYIMVEGSGVGDLGAQVMLERQVMAENGIVVIFLRIHPKSRALYGDPQILSRGFVHTKSSQHILDDLVKLSKKAYEELLKRDPQAKRADIKSYIKGRVDRYTHENLSKTPLVIPILVFS